MTQAIQVIDVAAINPEWEKHSKTSQEQKAFKDVVPTFLLIEECMLVL